MPRNEMKTIQRGVRTRLTDIGELPTYGDEKLIPNATASVIPTRAHMTNNGVELRYAHANTINSRSVINTLEIIPRWKPTPRKKYVNAAIMIMLT